MPGESSAVPSKDSVRLNHLQTSPPAGPESIQHNPQQPVAVVEAQATRGVLLENRQLVTKGEDLRLQGRTGLETGGYQSEKGNENRAHRGRYHDLTNDRNLCLFRLDGVFGNHNWFQESLPITRARGYSYLKATMGLTRMARLAGM